MTEYSEEFKAQVVADLDSVGPWHGERADVLRRHNVPDSTATRWEAAALRKQRDELGELVAATLDERDEARKMVRDLREGTLLGEDDPAWLWFSDPVPAFAPEHNDAA